MVTSLEKEVRRFTSAAMPAFGNWRNISGGKSGRSMRIDHKWSYRTRKSNKFMTQTTKGLKHRLCVQSQNQEVRLLLQTRNYAQSNGEMTLCLPSLEA